MAYIGNQPFTAAFLTDTFSGNGSTVAFTMTVAPANTSSILVAVTGVLQDPSTYAVSGTTLTFSQAPPSGTSNISVRYLGIPASGVTTTAYRTVTEFTATAGQTSFSVPSYTVGFVDVYRNGVMLGSADYTASSGTTIVLASGATAGDLVEVISFFVSSVLNAIPATAGSVGTTFLANNSVTTEKIALGAVIPADLAQPLTSGTAVASTSGTSIDFTGIPSWARRITVVLNNVSFSGSGSLRFQIGTSSGVETTGYNSAGGWVGASSTSATSSNGFDGFGDGAAALSRFGAFTFTLLGSNIWALTGSFNTATPYVFVTAGTKTLSGTLDRVRVTTTNGTDTFDAGSINILYE